MTPRWIATTLSAIAGLVAWSFAVAPMRSSELVHSQPRVPQAATPEGTVTGLWEVRTGVFRGPWTITLVQTDHRVAGTVQESFPVICATEPVAFDDGTLETTEAGVVVSFDLTGPAGTITFRGLVTGAGDAIAFRRSSTAPSGPIHTLLPAAPGLRDESGVLSPDGETHFVAHRVDPTTAPPPGCRIPDTPPGRPEVPRVRRYVATGKIGFPPWTFDLAIANGRVSGVVSQGRTDPATRMTTIVPGPFPISDGHADSSSIDFTITLGEGARVVTFHGIRSGAQAITFTRTMIVTSILSGADPGSNGIFGADGATHVTAVLDPSVDPPLAVPIPSGAAGDDTVTFDAVDARYAALPAARSDGGQAPAPPSGFALVRYHVGAGFQGRLVLTVSRATGGEVRQFEVAAAPGDHVALWNLRADAVASDGAIPSPRAPSELETAEARATLGSDLVRLATDDPDGTARLVGRMAALLAGPVTAPAVGPGPYVCALSRIEAVGSTTIGTLPLEVRAGGGL